MLWAYVMPPPPPPVVTVAEHGVGGKHQGRIRLHDARLGTNIDGHGPRQVLGEAERKQRHRASGLGEHQEDMAW